MAINGSIYRKNIKYKYQYKILRYRKSQEFHLDKREYLSKTYPSKNIFIG